jgi:ABC-type lipoprotein export system ATPase subunit
MISRPLPPPSFRNSQTLQSLTDTLATAYNDPSPSRIFSMMGPNGTGKSRLLSSLALTLRERNIPCLLIPPTRRITPHSADRPTFRLTRDPLQIPVDSSASPNINALWQQLMTSLLENGDHSGRTPIDAVLSALIDYCLRIDQSNEDKYRSAIVAYYDDGEQGVKPAREQALSLSLFAALASIMDCDEVSLGERAAVLDSTRHLSLVFRKNSRKFSATELSDGEKQILILAILLVTNTGKQCVLLVDEPELYLNDARAAELWSKIEAIFAQSIVLYATHNVSFATRPSTSKSWILDLVGNLHDVDLDKPVPSYIMHAIVGARIQLLRVTTPIIFCEDKMHELLFNDLFGPRYYVIGVGSCRAVIAATEREGAWLQVRSEGVPFCGIIDRDAYTDEQVSGLENRRVLCLPFYEAESILLAPAIAHLLLEKTLGTFIEEAEYISWLSTAARTYLGKAIQDTKCFMEYEGRVMLRVVYDDTHRVKSLDADATKLKTKFKERVDAMVTAAENGSVEDILRLLPGKELYKGVRQECDRNKGIKLQEGPEAAYRLMREWPACLPAMKSLAPISELMRKTEKVLGTGVA